jgi:hypothetical protein
VFSPRRRQIFSLMNWKMDLAQTYGSLTRLDNPFQEGLTAPCNNTRPVVHNQHAAKHWQAGPRDDYVGRFGKASSCVKALLWTQIEQLCDHASLLFDKLAGWA